MRVSSSLCMLLVGFSLGCSDKEGIAILGEDGAIGSESENITNMTEEDQTLKISRWSGISEVRHSCVFELESFRRIWGGLVGCVSNRI